ncbi:cytochrome b [Rhodobacteraceae bacterium CCMM004]|nr:cytochrome b [Rhodobacteraceae bacterium CCMM004]
MIRRYHPALVLLHWLIAVLLFAALGIGWLVLSEIPNSDPGKLTVLRAHMIAGAVLLILTVVRLAVRRRTAHPPPAESGHPLLDTLAVAMHWALYAAVLAMIGSGIALSAAAGLPEVVFFGSGAALPADFDAYAARTVHGAVATLLGVLILGHVAAALYHHLIRRDGLLRRMWFGPRSG